MFDVAAHVTGVSCGQIGSYFSHDLSVQIYNNMIEILKGKLNMLVVHLMH